MPGSRIYTLELDLWWKQSFQIPTSLLNHRMRGSDHRVFCQRTVRTISLHKEVLQNLISSFQPHLQRLWICSFHTYIFDRWCRVPLLRQTDSTHNKRAPRTSVKTPKKPTGQVESRINFWKVKKTGIESGKKNTRSISPRKSSKRRRSDAFRSSSC